MRKLLWLVTLLPAPAIAQISAPPFNMYPAIGAQMIQKQIDAQRRRAGPEEQALTAPVMTATTFRYTPSRERRRANLASFVEKARAVDPQGAAKMAQLFAGTDVIEAISRALAPVGLRTDDAADAYAVWWMSAWQAAHGDASAPNRTKAQAVRAQAARAIGATPEFARADEATRQEYAEALLVQAALIDAMVEEYGRDPARSAEVAAAVKQGARKSGLDLDTMTLTETGFVPAKRTGAAEPAPGARPKALAAAPADARPGYGFLAAAGGAGLGAAFLLGKAVGRRV